MGMTIRVTSLVCVGCGAILKATLLSGDALQQLSLNQQRCPKCGKDRFQAIITRTLSGYEAPSTEDYLLSVALSTHGPYGHTVTWDDVFELPDVRADDLIAHLSQAPEAVSEWITALRKEDAKAHLRPDQRLCAVCGDIFTVELVGYTREGFCSPLCKKKGAGAPVPSRTLAEAPGKVVPCVHCGQPVRPAPGAHCMHCGAKIPG